MVGLWAYNYFKINSIFKIPSMRRGDFFLLNFEKDINEMCILNSNDKAPFIRIEQLFYIFKMIEK